MSSIKEELRSISKHPKKTFGQNFLRDRNISERIVDSIPLPIGSVITEIGPGLGILTDSLLKKGYKVRALEIDEKFVDYLKVKYEKKIEKDIEIIHTDGVRSLKNDDRNESPYILSNLPYNISSYLMGYLLDSVDIKIGSYGFEGAIIMFQKEFGERLVASHGGKEYGKISIMFHLKMDHDILFKVPKEKFYPQPKVDGIVVRFSPKKEPIHIPNNDRFLRNLLNIIFSNRRKKLKNSILPGSINIDISGDLILKILKENGWEDLRPEQISPAEFVNLSNQLLNTTR